MKGWEKVSIEKKGLLLYIFNMKKIGIFASSLLLLASCTRVNTVASLNKSDLFSLSYGTFENELNVFDLSGAGQINTSMTMRDGFFYIANGEAKKIMELNSYGDLLSFYYNDEFSKAPSFASGVQGNTTKKAVVYPFNTLGPIAVDSKKNLYVVDTLPPEQYERDTENRLSLDRVVLRFDSSGKFVDYLGQQGPGGSPFPFIENIYTVADGELVVVCVTNDGPIAYWFNSKGFLQYKVPFTVSTVPRPRGLETDEGDMLHISIENVIPDLNFRRLYVKVDYSKTVLDPALKVQSGIEYDRTLLCPLDVETGRYGESFEVPPYEESVSENLSKEVFLQPYNFLGVSESGWFFFSVPTSRGYLIQLIQPENQKILKRSLDIDYSRILFNTFSVSANGILNGLFVERDKATVAWWRTDSLVSTVIEN